MSMANLTGTCLSLTHSHHLERTRLVVMLYQVSQGIEEVVGKRKSQEEFPRRDEVRVQSKGIDAIQKLCEALATSKPPDANCRHLWVMAQGEKTASIGNFLHTWVPNPPMSSKLTSSHYCSSDAVGDGQRGRHVGANDRGEKGEKWERPKFRHWTFFLKEDINNYLYYGEAPNNVSQPVQSCWVANQATQILQQNTLNPEKGQIMAESWSFILILKVSQKCFPG